MRKFVTICLTLALVFAYSGGGFDEALAAKRVAPAAKKSAQKKQAKKAAVSSKGKRSAVTGAGSGPSYGAALSDFAAPAAATAPVEDYSAPAPYQDPTQVYDAPAQEYQPAAPAVEDYSAPAYAAPAYADDLDFAPAPAPDAAPAARKDVAQVAVDVPNDKDWDDFRKCMLAQCEGLDGPANVGCYRELAFEDAFSACDYTFAASKKDAFRNYFWDEHLTAEQARACDEREGEYNKDTHSCKVVITYHRKADKGKSMFGKEVSGTGCNDTVERTYELGGKPVPCTHDTFGRPECREVNQSIQTQKDMAMLGGIVSLGTAAIGGVIGAVSTTASTKKQMDVVDPNDIKKGDYIELKDYNNAVQNATDSRNKAIEYNNSIDTNGGGKAAKLSAAWDAAGSGIVEGATSLGTAMIYDSVGGMVLGKCSTSDGNEYQEGSYIQLDW
jgi:hypothetical protein